MDLESIINSKSKFQMAEIDYILNNTDNQTDYLLLNYMEQKIIEIHGPEFIKNNTTKIQYIMGIILQNNIDDYEKLYSGCFDEYMKSCNNDMRAAPGFNIIFIVLTHIAIKILRKNKK